MMTFQLIKKTERSEKYDDIKDRDLKRYGNINYQLKADTVSC